MRILITGAEGQLGHELRRVLHRETLELAELPDFDLLKPDVRERICAAQPEVVIHAAGYTDVDGAEREAELAMAINAGGTEQVARAAAKAGARLLYLSTDYVFDGHKGSPYREMDEPNPINAYGRSKAAGEQAIEAAGGRSLMIRTSWLYAPWGNNFVKTILKLAQSRDHHLGRKRERGQGQT